MKHDEVPGPDAVAAITAASTRAPPSRRVQIDGVARVQGTAPGPHSEAGSCQNTPDDAGQKTLENCCRSMS